MRKTTLACEVTTPSGEVRFVFFAHSTDSPEERFIEAKFYEENCKPGEIPDGVHHELQIMAPAVWRHKHARHIHTHSVGGKSERGRVFVCWTGSLPTLEMVRSMLETWCIGTAFTMDKGEGFGAEYGKGSDSFSERMREQGYEVKNYTEI